MEKEGALINCISSNILRYKHKIIYNNERRTEQRLTQKMPLTKRRRRRLYSNEVATISALKLTGYADGSPQTAAILGFIEAPNNILSTLVYQQELLHDLFDTGGAVWTMIVAFEKGERKEWFEKEKGKRIFKRQKKQLIIFPPNSFSRHVAHRQMVLLNRLLVH